MFCHPAFDIRELTSKMSDEFRKFTQGSRYFGLIATLEIGKEVPTKNKRHTLKWSNLHIYARFLLN